VVKKVLNEHQDNGREKSVHSQLNNQKSSIVNLFPAFPRRRRGAKGLGVAGPLDALEPATAPGWLAA